MAQKKLHPAELEQKQRIQKVDRILSDILEPLLRLSDEEKLTSPSWQALQSFALNVPDHILNVHVTRLDQIQAKKDEDEAKRKPKPQPEG
jgi:hypothetical protein